MNFTIDTSYIVESRKSYALDDWRAKLVIGILETALHDLLGYRSPKELVREAEDFIYDDNVMFELCMNILGMEKDLFRERVAMMKMKGERLRRTSEGSGGYREQK
jgi:hypothetical protein